MKTSKYTSAVVAALLLCSCTSGGGDNIAISSSGDTADPVTVTVAVAYLERPLPEQPFDIRSPTAFNPGAELFVRNPSSFDGEEISLNEQILSIVAEEENVDVSELLIDIKDLETSYDGKTLVFAARVVPMPESANLELSTWNLWQYDFDSAEANYVIPSRLIRREGFENGSAQDTAPHFLSNDKIIFSSTRQFVSQGRQLDDGRAQIYPALSEGRDEPASVLHLYDPENEGDPITQISFNQSHDFDPLQRASGEIVFSRWNNSQGNNQISLFQINPDGGDLSHLYGNHSGDSGSLDTAVHYTQVRELADGSLAAILRTFASPTLGGNLVLIDSEQFVEASRGVWGNENSNTAGQESLTTQEVRTDALRSEGGQYAAFYPLHDDSGRMLVSWSPCRIVVDNVPTPCNIVEQQIDEVLAPPLYGLWIHDSSAGTQLPMVIAREGVFISEVVAATVRNFPAIAPQLNDIDSDLIADGKGMLLIDSVYDFDGLDQSTAGIFNHAEPGTSSFADRPARFIRFVKPVPIPDDDIFEIPNYAFGVNSSQSMREIIGYAVVEPDGSVAVSVPADTPFSFSVLDANGRRISSRHNHWLQLVAGEILHCTGCHSDSSTLAHGRIDSKPTPANSGAVTMGSSIGFLNTNPNLFAIALGQTMAEIYLLHFPLRAMTLDPSYTDEWGDGSDPAIDFSYPTDWTDGDTLPSDVDNIATSMVVRSLDADKDSRIVINYIDHIQTIWDRSRIDILDDTVSCSGCHRAVDGVVAPGQLELTDTASDLQPVEHYRSYHELLRSDVKEIVNTTVVNYTRSCTETTVDAQGNTIVLATTQDVTVAATMNAGSAANSSRFFGCFEGELCGRNNDPEPALDVNCSEPTGTIIPPTSNSYDHNGLLTTAELRLISEWLDIGAQYYNNPFDERLNP